MKFKRIIFACMISLLLACALIISTSAEEPDDIDRAEFYGIMRDAILNGETFVNVEKFNIHKDDIYDYYKAFMWENPDVSFCIDKSVKYSYYEQTGMIVEIEILYDDPTTITSRHEWLIGEIDRITANVNPEWNDLQKMLWINDYVCDNFRYELDTMYRTAYDMLYTGEAICEGYMMLTTLLAQEFNIQASFCYSDDLAHIWNIVQLDGQWYHIDTTWNDSYQDRYEYFLLSDAEHYTSRKSQTLNDFDVNQIYAANGNKYDNAFWRDGIYSSFVFFEEDAYYMQKNCIMLADLTTLTTTEVASLGRETWKDSVQHGYWLNDFFDLAQFGDLMLYNTSNSVYAFSLDTQKTALLFTSNKSANIFAIRIVGDKMVLNYCTDVQNDIFTQETIDIPGTHRVRYFVDGHLYDTQTYVNDSALLYPETPSKEGFVFTGWSIPEGTIVRSDLEIAAIFKEIFPDCNVFFMANGEIYDKVVVPNGEEIVPPSVLPVKEADAYYTYQFSSWRNYHHGIVACGSTMVFIADFEQTPRMYEVSFYDQDEKISSTMCIAGTLLDDVDMPNAEDKTVGGTKYVFREWKLPDSKEILSNIDLYAIYDKQPVFVKVRYYNEGILLFEESAAVGTNLAYTNVIPTKPPTSTHYYVFDGWIGAQEGTIIGNTDVELHAVFHEISNPPPIDTNEDTTDSTNTNHNDFQDQSSDDGFSIDSDIIKFAAIALLIVILTAIILVWKSKRK